MERSTKPIWIAITIAGLLAAVLALTVAPRYAQAAEPKNLKVLPKDMSKKAVKKLMKTWAKGLGVECDYCHDMDDMSLDTKKKKAGRKMYEMTQYINKKYMKKLDAEVTCKSCHQGAEEPKK